MGGLAGLAKGGGVTTGTKPPGTTTPAPPQPPPASFPTPEMVWGGGNGARNLVARWVRGSSAGGGGAATETPGARAYLESVLGEYGLESLTDWAYDLLVKGYQVEYIMAELRKRPEFADRFPAIAARRAAGLPPISPSEYVALERTYDAYMHAAGLSGFFNRKDLYTKWIGGDVSPAEAKGRVDEVHQALMMEPLETRQELERMFGVQAGPAAIAYFLDPENSLPLIQEQVRQASIGGGAIRSMYGLISADEAKMLDQLGVDAQGAQEGFGDLVRRRELMGSLPGEAGTTITRNEQIAAEFAGDAVAQQAIEQQASRRRARAAGGAAYRRTRTGVAGLGEATT